MDRYFDLEVSDNGEYSQTFQDTTEIQIKVTFEETFPFSELQELMQIVEGSEELVRMHILPKALEVAMRMQSRFCHSLSDEYPKWLVMVHNSIETLKRYTKELSENSTLFLG